MIHHIVMWKLKETAEGTSRAENVVHPTHQALKGFVGAVRESRECVDYEI